MRARFQAAVERLTDLAVGSGPSAPAGSKLSPALAANCGNYKQAVFALADTQRTDLHLHEANMAVSQRNLAQAWTRRELLGKVLAQHEAAFAREQDRAQRKREDEIATQSWLAGRADKAVEQ
jgi:flagellar export protein FliJ